MIQYKCFFDFAKEEQWLSEMAENGFAVTNVNCCGKYTFQKIVPQKYDYRIDYRVFKNLRDFQDYCTLFEDSGWMHLCGTKNSGSQYFVQIGANALSDIFSDSASKAGRYKRFSDMWLSLFCCFIPIFTALFTTNVIKMSAFTNPKALYYTPGLWNRKGIDFWRAFLFETPFAIGRGFMWLIVLLALLLYLYYYLRAFLLYRHYSKES